MQVAERADVVAFDEAQFFEPADLQSRARALLRRGKTVIVAGLDMDATGNVFSSGVVALMAEADEVLKLKAVCTKCGVDAGMTAKTAGGLERVEIGGQEKYEARCREHWS